jgi:hypothetical protein
MHEGAFALIDCLGFKGIWKRADEATLLNKLESIVSQVDQQLLTGVPFQLLERDWMISASLLSDSVAISLRYKDKDEKVHQSNTLVGKRRPKKAARKKKKGKGTIEERRINEREKSYLVWLIAASTIKILDLFLEGDPSLLLRGCITYGEHEKRENFIVGPAVDIAAENRDSAQGAFVWLHPTATPRYKRSVQAVRNTIKILSCTRKDEELLSGSKFALSQPIMVEDYNMPLKVGGHFQCSVLNPLAFHETEEARREVIRKYSRSLTDNHFDVMLKHQYTMEFLKAAEAARVAHERTYKEFIVSL